ncbi:DUF2332 domain-containing protein [Agrobacterium vitis]
MTIDSLRHALTDQARSCDILGSPFTARLCRLAAERLTPESAIGARLIDWPGDITSAGDSVPLRLAGTLHALVLSNESPALAAVYSPHTATDDALWAAVEAAFGQHQAFMQARLNSAPQTNEVRRSAALLPGFLTIASLFGLPLRLSEVGASAGLNLQWDRYAYRLGETSWGDGSPVLLAPDWQGPPPPSATINVEERAGCDLNPLDPGTPEDCERLFSYIWADQADRLERTKAALALARSNNLSVERMDAIDWLKQRLAPSHPGQMHVVYHSVAWQYLPDTLKAQGEALITQAGQRATAQAPFARLQMEADGQRDGASLNLQIWPGGERQEIGRADFHGRWVKWQGWTA